MAPPARYNFTNAFLAVWVFRIMWGIEATKHRAVLKAFPIAMSSCHLDQYPCLVLGVADLPVQQFSSQLAIEALPLDQLRLIFSPGDCFLRDGYRFTYLYIALGGDLDAVI